MIWKLVTLASVVAVLSVSVACAKRGDSAQCKRRLESFQQRIDSLSSAAPPLPHLDLADVPSKRARPLGAKPLILEVLRVGGVQEGGKWRLYRFEGKLYSRDGLMTALEPFEKAQPTGLQLHVGIDARTSVTHLARLLARLDANIELRLLVETPKIAARWMPADVPADSRQQLEELKQLNAEQRVQALTAITVKAIGACKMKFEHGPKTQFGAIVKQARSCGCKAVDIPTLEAALLKTLGASSTRGWIPLRLEENSLTGTVQDLANGAQPLSAAPEPGLGAVCRTRIDCKPGAPDCLSFDATGQHDETAGHYRSCSRRCGSGCPAGYVCTVLVTGVDLSRPTRPTLRKGRWCGKLRDRTARVPLAKIPREGALRYLSGNLAPASNRPTLFYGKDGHLAIAARGRFRRFNNRADATKAFTLVAELHPRTRRPNNLIPLSLESVTNGQSARPERFKRALQSLTVRAAYERFSPKGIAPKRGAILYWSGPDAGWKLIDRQSSRTFRTVADALAAFHRASRPRP